jgi:hypothetical protein
MAWITFRCSSCNKGLKVGADKAGRKVKCTGCGTPLTIPSPSPTEPAAGAQPAPASAPGKRPWDEEEDAGGVYGVEGLSPTREEAPPPPRRPLRDEEEDEDEEEEEEYDPEEIAEKDEALRRRLMGLEEGEEEEEEDRPRRKARAPKLDATVWEKVRLANVLVAASVGLWALAFVVRETYVVIGLTSSASYSTVVDELHPHYQLPPDEEKTVDIPKLVLSLTGGLKLYDTNRILLIVSQILMILQGGVMITACIFCLRVPHKFGAKGFVVATLVVTSINVFTGVLFRLLPLAGAINYLLVPLVGPEIAMHNANIGRIIPLHLLWSGNPYVQVLISVFVILLCYAELALYPMFLRATAKTMKSEKLEQTTLALIELALSQLFMQVAYQLLAMAGTSDVMVQWILRAVYCLALGFFVWQLVWYILILLQTRNVIQTMLRRQERELRREAAEEEKMRDEGH